jgi:uncharacterized protein YjcR
MADMADLTEQFKEIDLRRTEAVADYRQGRRLTEVAEAHGVPVPVLVDWIQEEPWG